MIIKRYNNISSFWHKKTECGFTLVELIAVLLILSVAGVFIGEYKPSHNANLVGEIEIIKSHLRYIRYLALSNDSKSWKIYFTDNSYIVYEKTSDEPLMLPNEDSAPRFLSPGLTVELSQNGGAEIVDHIIFDKWGSPADHMTYQVKVSDTASGEYRLFRITKNTGFIR
ncbi:pilus assembly FimT family protein [Desulfonema ishimotonii]